MYAEPSPKSNFITCLVLLLLGLIILLFKEQNIQATTTALHAAPQKIPLHDSAVAVDTVLLCKFQSISGKGSVYNKMCVHMIPTSLCFNLG